MLIPTAILFNLLSRFEFIIYLTHDYVFGTFRVVVVSDTPYSTGNLHKKKKQSLHIRIIGRKVFYHHEGIRR